jgi:hypothetical protein
MESGKNYAWLVSKDFLRNGSELPKKAQVPVLEAPPSKYRYLASKCKKFWFLPGDYFL